MVTRLLLIAKHLHKLVDMRLKMLLGENYTEREALNRKRMEIEYYYKTRLNTQCFAFGVFMNNELVSTCTLNVYSTVPGLGDNGMFGEITNVYTSPAYRNNGFASQCIKEAVMKAKELNLTIARLYADEGTEEFYKILNFKDTYDVVKCRDMRVYLFNN